MRTHVNGYPLDRPRFRRHERRPGGRAQDMMPHDETPGSQMYEGTGKVAALRDESRPLQPQGGYRDGLPLGRGEPAELGSDSCVELGSRARVDVAEALPCPLEFAVCVLE